MFYPTKNRSRLFIAYRFAIISSTINIMKCTRHCEIHVCVCRVERSLFNGKRKSKSFSIITSNEHKRQNNQQLFCIAFSFTSNLDLYLRNVL